MGLDRSFWRGKRVLLTGHTGFKGSWLGAWLHELEAEIQGFALDPPSRPSLFELADLHSVLRDRRGDVCDPAAVQAVLADSGAEIVLHLAAQSLVRRSWENPEETYATNVLGTVNLLQAIRSAKTVRAVLVVTSDKCYANEESGRLFTESDPLGGLDPYSTSKACQELVVQTFRQPLREAGVHLASARSGNVIGGGDWAQDRLIPDAVRAFEKGDSLRLRYPAAVRPWQHVLDPLHGYLLLTQALYRDEDATGAWNFGPEADDMLPVGEVADRFAAHWGKAAGWKADGRSHPPEAGLLRLDSRKAREGLKWRNQLGLDEALAWTFGWYRKWRGGDDPMAATREQLQAFQERCGEAA